jgi:hypothetical protein
VLHVASFPVPAHQSSGDLAARCYEDPKVSVNVAIDDVLAKKQRDSRRRPRAKSGGRVSESDTTENKSAEVEKPKKIYTTVAHVQPWFEQRTVDFRLAA